MPPAKSASVKELEGNRGHWPIKVVPQFSEQLSGMVEAPAEMSEAVKRIWYDYQLRANRQSFLTLLDIPAFVALCEDQAMLIKLRKALYDHLDQDQLIDIIDFASTIEGSRILNKLEQLAARVMRREKEFGLTPASRSRVELPLLPLGETMDPLEKALCAGKKL